MPRQPNYSRRLTTPPTPEIVFLLVAGLALLSGVAGGKADTKSAVSTLLEQPFGRGSGSAS